MKSLSRAGRRLACVPFNKLEATLAKLGLMPGGLRAATRSALSAQGGNVAIIFALCAVVAVPLAAFGIDYARASRVKADLQEGLDAATLAAARSGPNASISDVGNGVLLAHTGAVNGLSGIKPKFEIQGDVVVGTATAQVKPFFPAFHLGKSFDVGARTQVKRGVSGNLELALVLDTTFSMTGPSGSKTKLEALKVAAKDLVQTITKDPKADVKIAVIPFAQYVNVGVSRRNQPWVDVGSDYRTGSEQQCTTTYNTAITKETVCSTYEKKTCTGTKDGTSYTYSCNGACTKWKENTYPQGKPSTSCKGGYTNYKFFGCVGSPAYPKNVEDSDPNRRYPGLLQTSSSCGAEITPLTTNKGQVISAIENLTAVGETYIPSGLAWGFNALSQAQPLTEAAAYDPANTKPRKALVLMTDGENTKYLQPKSNPAGMHNGNSAQSPAPSTQSNDFTLELCTNAKKAGIEIYTVAFQVTNAAAKDLMRKCATDGEHNFDASNAAKLEEAFASIAESLKSIYISR